MLRILEIFWQNEMKNGLYIDFRLGWRYSACSDEILLCIGKMYAIMKLMLLMCCRFKYLVPAGIIPTGRRNNTPPVFLFLLRWCFSSSSLIHSSASSHRTVIYNEASQHYNSYKYIYCMNNGYFPITYNWFYFVSGGSLEIPNAVLELRKHQKTPTNKGHTESSSITTSTMTTKRDRGARGRAKRSTVYSSTTDERGAPFEQALGEWFVEKGIPFKNEDTLRSGAAWEARHSSKEAKVARSNSAVPDFFFPGIVYINVSWIDAKHYMILWSKTRYDTASSK